MELKYLAACQAFVDTVVKKTTLDLADLTF